MLFHYKYINHSIEKMQDFISCIFNDVWCQAPGNEYGIDLFANEPDLVKIIDYFWNQELAGDVDKTVKFFLTGINEIFIDFKELEPSEISKFQSWFNANNDIENCCNGTETGITYKELKEEFPDLSKKLKKFFEKLYSQNFLKHLQIKKHIGTLKDHYDEFTRLNDDGICPFCGLYPIDGQYSNSKEAYDHYLPKSKYPFNSINFKNLVPTCNKCNSTNKGSKDPLNKSGNSRKAFFPYCTTPSVLKFGIELNISDWLDYTPEEIELRIESDNQEEVDTWLDVYGLESRYKDFLCKRHFGKLWLGDLLKWRNRGNDISQMMEDLEERPTISEHNFLKLPFLKKCIELEMFNEEGV